MRGASSNWVDLPNVTVVCWICVDPADAVPALVVIEGRPFLPCRASPPYVKGRETEAFHVHRPFVIESLEKAAISLEEAAGRLREAIFKLTGDEPSSGPLAFEDAHRSNGSSHDADERARWVAKRMREFWRGVSLGSEMPVGPVTVDLATPKGRWQLLVLAVLRGARVREHVVEETFSVLVERGLTDLDRLAAASASIRAELQEVFEAHYRALGRREAKVEALISNAALLKSEYEGDLHTLYRTHREEPDVLIKALQRFKQVGQVAYWICRTLKVHGVWPDLDPSVVQYVDRFTDLPLHRLELCSPFDEERLGTRALRFANELLQGDTTPLYLHGLILCSQDDYGICLSECPLDAACRYVRRPE